MNIPPHTLARGLPGARFGSRLKRCFLTAAVGLGLGFSCATLHAQLPSPWQSQDIGTTGAPGTSSHSSGTFTIEGAGDDVWNSSDQFRYAYQTLSGDFTIVARVQSAENTHQWAKVGVMIRETLDVGSKYAFAFMTPSVANGGKFEYRNATNGSSATGGQFASTTVPRWVRLARVGHTFTAAQSADGSSWTSIGGAQTITMASTVRIGLAVCSSVTSTLCTGVFTNVTVSNNLPSPWSTQDIGVTGPAGSASHSSGTFTVTGEGTEVYYASDSFRYVHQTITGDGTITARVASVQNTNQYAKVGVMFRQSLATDAAYSFLLITPDLTNDRGILFESRASAGAGSTQTSNQPGYVPPYWLRLARSGNTFTASRSTDGNTWTTVGSHAVAMTGPVQVGLVVCSHAPGTLNTSTFSNVSVTTSSVYNPNFPRLGIYAISGTGSLGQAFLPEARTVLSKFHLVVLGGSYEGWATGRGYTKEDVVTDIKTQSIVGTKVFQYVILMESRGVNPQLPTWDARVASNNWWLYQLGTSGARVESPYGAGRTEDVWAVNMTQYAPNDVATGKRPFVWGAEFIHDVFINPAGTYGAAGMAAPSLDGIFLDNVFPYTKSDGDWNRNSATGDATDLGYEDYNDYNETSAVWWRAAQIEYFNRIRQLMPGKLQIGNTAEFPNVARPLMTDLTKLGVLNQALEGGILEPALGKAHAAEEWGNPNRTDTMLRWYRYTIDALSGPKLLIFQQWLSATGTDYVDATAYRAMRYGLACCLMNNGYWDGNPENQTRAVADTRWFDELSVYQGVGQSLTSANVHAGLGYLGQPVAGTQGAVQAAPRWPTKGTYGVWAREFAGGLVLMNPRGNGARTVTVAELGGSTLWKRISGTQASSINNGANVTADITLADRDAIILLRR